MIFTFTLSFQIRVLYIVTLTHVIIGGYLSTNQARHYLSSVIGIEV